jgi:hypothetical protein
MSFETVTLADVVLDKPEQPGVGEYILELLPLAVWREHRFFKQADGSPQMELSMQATIAEGDFAGRRVFFSYGDPTVIKPNGKPNSIEAQKMKKLEIVLGGDALPGEAVADTFNRLASSGYNRFAASLVEETRYNKETQKYEPYIRAGNEKPVAVFSPFSVKAAA